MFKRGLISAEEARHHPDKNVIFRALGSHAEVEIPTWEGSVREGDRFILCSDGLHDLVENHEIEKAIIAYEPHAACEMLVDLAKERGGHDNITVAIVWLEPATQEEPKGVRLTRDAEVMA
jgi:protein phosphatase